MADDETKVQFGPVVFQHVLEVDFAANQVLLDTVVPARNVDHWTPSTAWNKGRTATVSGEIRATTIAWAANELAKLRRLRDGVTRLFDMQDGVTTFNAKMGDIHSTILAGNWYPGWYFIEYSVDLWESAY
ncbi:MAG: hypothetical protein ABSF00_03410 [Candidatus Bathyarchaeia archaeon]|jgi:hypothetical protein